MALHTLGTAGATSLTCLAAWGEGLTDADIAAIAQSIVGDGRFASRLGGGPSGASGVLATGSTHSNTTLDTLVTAGGGPLSSIALGDLVLGAGIPAATFVAAKPTGTSVTLSQAATATANSVDVAFVRPPAPQFSRNGLLTIPGRGILKVQPGDVVALDRATGWPILVSAAAISYAGSLWSFS